LRSRPTAAAPVELRRLHVGRQDAPRGHCGESALNDALRQFEAVEANLVKAESALDDVMARIPDGLCFGDDPEYERDAWAFQELVESLPAIDGWKPAIQVKGLNDIAQERFDAREVGEIECIVSVEEDVEEPVRLLREYRYRFDKKRRALVRGAVDQLVDLVDHDLATMEEYLETDGAENDPVDDPAFDQLGDHIAQINTLLGSVERPPRWSDLHRHLGFALRLDARDIIHLDWPAVRSGLRRSLYGEKEPVPVEIADIGDLVKDKPAGPVATKLLWDRLGDEEFERLVFALISARTDTRTRSG